MHQNTPTQSRQHAPENAKSQAYRRSDLIALAYAVIFFFAWGLLGKMNSVITPYLREAFSLSFTSATLLQVSFFISYALFSIPSGIVINRLGYRIGLSAGLIIAGFGALLFFIAASVFSYPVFLAGMFTIAMGIVVLQVSANPYVISIGSPERASQRLNFCQAFNSLGAVTAPLAGSVLFLTGSPETSLASEQLSIGPPYLLFSGVLIVTGLVVLSSRKIVPSQTPGQPIRASDIIETIQDRRLMLGAIAIFFYVGAEVGIGTFLIDFLTKPEIMGLTLDVAARYASLYFAAAMAGRFIGFVTMHWILPERLLALTTLGAALLVFASISGSGAFAMWTLLAVGLCNSIVFPTVFALATTHLAEKKSIGSGVLCTAITGGAVLPFTQGLIADAHGLQSGFIVPLIAYLVVLMITIFGLRQSRANPDMKEAAI